MSFAATRLLPGASPILGALARAQPVAAPPAPAVEPEPSLLSQRLDARMAEIEAKGYRICWLEMGRDELLTLFRELGDEAVRLDPDPAKDCGWYGPHEVRYAGRELVWIYLEGEVPGEVSVHVVA